MADEQSPVVGTEGQAAATPDPSGTIAQAPEGQTGQAIAPDSQDAGQAPSPQPTDEQSFFDPTSLAPELLPAYKLMQGKFTQNMQRIKAQEKKLQAYEAFERAPLAQEVQQFLAQYGYVPAHIMQQYQAQQSQQQAQPQKDWEPQSWDELMQRAREEGATLAEQRILQKLEPYIAQQQAQTAKTIEQQLASIDPKWRDYEPEMKDLLGRYPEMVRELDRLYRNAVPHEVLQAKAIQEALDKFNSKAQHATVATKSSAPRSSPAKAKVASFDEAVAQAKAELGLK